MEREDIVSRMKRKFVLSVQLDPPTPGEENNWNEFVNRLRHFGVDTVDVNSSKIVPSADSLAVAAGLLSQFSEVIPHIAVRDNGVTRFVNQIYWLYQHFGLRALLVIKGDPYPSQGRCYDDEGWLESFNVIDALHNELRESGICPHLKIGAAFDHNKPLWRESYFKNLKKSCGADFFMSQNVFSHEQLAILVERFGRNAPLMIGLFPLPYAKIAKWIAADKLPGVVLPKEIVAEAEVFKWKDEHLEEWTVERTARLLVAARAMWTPEGGVQGAYLVTPRRKPEVVLRIIRRAEELSR